MDCSINMIFYSKEFFSSGADVTGMMLMLLRKIPSFQPSCDVVRQLSSTELNKMLLSRFVYNAISSSLVWTITVQFIPLDLDWSFLQYFFTSIMIQIDQLVSSGDTSLLNYFGQDRKPWKLYCLWSLWHIFPSHIYTSTYWVNKMTSM